MISHSNLYSLIVSWENMIEAARKAAKGKRMRENLMRFDHEFTDSLCRLRDELVSEMYRPGPYREFFIYESKKRLISAAPYRDRIVHHALCAVIMPIFEKTLVDTSFANRLGKGTHRAVLYAGETCAHTPCT